MSNPFTSERTSILGPKGLPIAYFIRDIRVEPALVMAPMEGVTNLSFRRLMRRIGGIGLSCTEFIPSRSLSNHGKHDLRTAQFDDDERPISIQIYGKDPQVMADAARVVQDLGADICDINMGCPSKKVCSNSGGSALMKDLNHAAKIVQHVRAAIEIPLTVKMRSGFDADNRNAPTLAKICESEGAEAITIHWRTREDRYGGQRLVDMLAEAKSNLNIPLIANGDIVDIPSMVQMYKETNCDGFMIGRGMMKNPWCMKQMEAYLYDQTPMTVTSENRKTLLLDYLDRYMHLYQAERPTLGKFKQLIKHFCTDIPNGNDFRHQLLRAKTIEDVRSIVDAHFDLDRGMMA